MKKYFIHDGRQQLGPFSATELIERGITKCTPVYTAGMGRYVRAAEIPVLNDAFGKTPDEINNAVPAYTVEKHRSPMIKNMAWVVGALLIIVIPYIVYKLQVEIPDAPLPASSIGLPVKQDAQLSKSSLEQKEATNPLQYLTVHGKMRKNLIGKKIIKGSITNLASMASYKDVQMAITFLSSDEKELQTQQFFVNEFVTPNNAVNFRNVFSAPSETEGFRIKVLSATSTP